MHSVLRSRAFGVLLVMVVAMGCQRPAGPDKAAAVPAAAPVDAKAAAAAGAAGAQAATSKVDLNQIFPAGRGRELVLNNCTTCHTFVPIVILQMNKQAWERNSRDHRGRVSSLSDADFKVLYEYLAANFGPGKPVPRLPNELMETWTSY